MLGDKKKKEKENEDDDYEMGEFRGKYIMYDRLFFEVGWFRLRSGMWFEAPLWGLQIDFRSSAEVWPWFLGNRPNLNHDLKPAGAGFKSIFYNQPNFNHDLKPAPAGFKSIFL